MLTIKQLVISLQVDAEQYKRTFDELSNNYNLSVAEVKKTMIPGTSRYKKELQDSENQFDVSIAKLRAKYAEDSASDIDELRQYELAKIKKFDRQKLSELSELHSLPITLNEMLVLAEKYRGDYWAERSLQVLCDENSIDTCEIGLSTTLDTKLNVLDQLQEQMECILKYYGERGVDREQERKVRLLYLNDSVVNNAVEIYEGKTSVRSAEDQAKYSLMTIAGRRTDSEKGIILGNLLRNAKGAKRQELLSAIKADTSISSFAKQFSGFGEEIDAFDNIGFIQAKQAIGKLETLRDASMIQLVLDDLEGNMFLDDMIATNASLKKGIEKDKYGKWQVKEGKVTEDGKNSEETGEVSQENAE